MDEIIEKWNALQYVYKGLTDIYARLQQALPGLPPELASRVESELGYFPKAQAAFEKARAAVAPYLGGYLGAIPLAAVAIVAAIAAAGIYISNRYTAAKKLDAEITAIKMESPGAGLALTVAETAKTSSPLIIVAIIAGILFFIVQEFKK